MLWFPILVLIGLGLLASVTLLSALKIVVLALVALPAAIWKLEVSLIFLTKTLLIVFVLEERLSGLPVVASLDWSIIVNYNIVDCLWDEALLLWGLIYLLRRIEGFLAKDSWTREE